MAPTLLNCTINVHFWLGYLAGYRVPSEVYSMQWRAHHLMAALIIFNVTQLELIEIQEQLVCHGERSIKSIDY